MGKLTIINAVKPECCNTITLSSRYKYRGNFKYENCDGQEVIDKIENYLVIGDDGIGDVGSEGQNDRYFYEICGRRIITMPESDEPVVVNQPFTLRDSYTHDTGNRHYAGTGGGPMSPSYYGTVFSINFKDLLGTSNGFVRFPNATNRNSAPSLHGLDIENSSTRHVYGANESIPVDTLVEIHHDFQDRRDEIRRKSVTFEYSTDGSQWQSTSLVMVMPEELTTYNHR